MKIVAALLTDELQVGDIESNKIEDLMHFANRYQSIFIEEKLSEIPLLTERFYVYIDLAKKHRLLHLVAK